jgi:hypothetical protein
VTNRISSETSQSASRAAQGRANSTSDLLNSVQQALVAGTKILARIAEGQKAEPHDVGQFLNTAAHTARSVQASFEVTHVAERLGLKPLFPALKLALAGLEHFAGNRTLQAQAAFQAAERAASAANSFAPPTTPPPIEVTPTTPQSTATHGQKDVGWTVSTPETTARETTAGLQGPTDGTRQLLRSLVSAANHGATRPFREALTAIKNARDAAKNENEGTPQGRDTLNALLNHLEQDIKLPLIPPPLISKDKALNQATPEERAFIKQRSLELKSAGDEYAGSPEFPKALQLVNEKAISQGQYQAFRKALFEVHNLYVFAAQFVWKDPPLPSP